MTISAREARKRLKDELESLYTAREAAARRLELVTVFSIDCYIRDLYQHADSPRDLLIFLVNHKACW